MLDQPQSLQWPNLTLGPVPALPSQQGSSIRRLSLRRSIYRNMHSSLPDRCPLLAGSPPTCCDNPFQGAGPKALQFPAHMARQEDIVHKSQTYALSW